MKQSVLSQWTVRSVSAILAVLLTACMGFSGCSKKPADDDTGATTTTTVSADGGNSDGSGDATGTATTVTDANGNVVTTTTVRGQTSKTNGGGTAATTKPVDNYTPTITVPKGEEIGIVKLQTDYRNNPLGIDDTTPQLSWTIDSTRRGEKQTGYRVGVSSTRENAAKGNFDVWDSGYVQSADTSVVYGSVTGKNGKKAAALKARTQYYWTVYAWNKNKVENRSTEIATFEIALLGNFGSSNKWIVAKETESGSKKAKETAGRLFRKQFALSQSKTNVVKARLYSTAAGNQIMYMNGKRVSDDYFAPGKSQYTTMLYYQTYDVTDLLLNGDNTVGAEVGQGWYNAGTVASNYGSTVALKAKLIVTYKDGTEQVIDTDSSWQGTLHGATQSNRFYDGQVVDGREYIAGWCENGNKSSKFTAVSAIDSVVTNYGAIGKTFVAENMEPVRNILTKNPTSATKKSNRAYLYTFDQNVVGTLRITAKASAGTKITIRYCEFLTNGSITGGEYDGHNGQDTYIFRGDAGGETVTFDLVYHGFQYILISGLTEQIELKNIEALVLSSDMEETGMLETSNSKINRYVQNVLWSVRGNFVSTLTDCPTREKNTWTGDAQIFAAASSYFSNVFNHYRNFQLMTRHSQYKNGAIPEIVPDGATNNHTTASASQYAPAGWSDSVVIIPWEMYNQFGDTSIITENYDAMKNWINYILTCKINQAGAEVPYYVKDATDLRLDGTYGDWLHINGPASYYQKRTANATDLSAVPVSYAEVGTAYTAYCCLILSEMASAIGKTSDATYYKQLHERFAKAWRKNFVAADGYTCLSGGTSVYDSTTKTYTAYKPGEGWYTSYALGIYFDLFETEELKKKAAEKLASLLKDKNYAQNIGFMGMNTIYPALSWNGQFDAAMKMMEKETLPSLLYMVNQGATTIWETYEGTTYSRNHYVFGAPCRWLFTDVLGISHNYDADNAGYQHFDLQPHYASYSDTSVTSCKGSYTSRAGTIKSEWKLSSDRKTFTYKCTVPANTSATLSLPVEKANATITEGGKDASKAEGVKFIEVKDGRAYYEITSGVYEFVVKNG